MKHPFTSNSIPGIGRALVAAGLLTLLGSMAATLPASAASPTQVDWSQQDTAVYVVSTLNLVRTGDGRPLVPLVTESYGVRRFAVWQDLLTQAYVLQLKQESGRNAAQLVYRLGWVKPAGYSRLTTQLGIPRPRPPIEGHFRTHPRLLIGIFRTTLPS